MNEIRVWSIQKEHSQTGAGWLLNWTTQHRRKQTHLDCKSSGLPPPYTPTLTVFQGMPLLKNISRTIP